jgi:uncharacterized cupredoxin-like copper-binding protein
MGIVILEPEALRRHAAMMRMMPDMLHSGPNMASLAPGERGELIWKFTRSGTVTFACLQIGHIEAGMRGSEAHRSRGIEQFTPCPLFFDVE